MFLVTLVLGKGQTTLTWLHGLRLMSRVLLCSVRETCQLAQTTLTVRLATGNALCKLLAVYKMACENFQVSMQDLPLGQTY